MISDRNVQPASESASATRHGIPRRLLRGTPRPWAIYCAELPTREVRALCLASRPCGLPLALLVGVAEVEEQNATGFQHVAHPVECGDEVVDEALNGWLHPELAFDTVVALPVVRRTRDCAIDGVGREALENLSRIAAVDAPIRR